MTSTEYKTSVGNVFDTACDELGFELAIVTHMGALLGRIERRGYSESEAARMVFDGLKDASLSRCIAKSNDQVSLKKDLERIESLESALSDIESIARSA